MRRFVASNGYPRTVPVYWAWLVKTWYIPLPYLASFETVNNDIQFGVLFSTTEDSKQGLLTSGGDKGDEEADMEVQEVVVERQRFASHMGPVTGTFHLARPGRLTLVWDNG